MEFFRQKYWNGLPFPSPGDLPNPGTESWPPALQANSLPLSHQGSQDALRITQNALGLPTWLGGEEPACQAADVGLVPGSGPFLHSSRNALNHTLPFHCQKLKKKKKKTWKSYILNFLLMLRTFGLLIIF